MTDAESVRFLVDRLFGDDRPWAKHQHDGNDNCLYCGVPLCESEPPPKFCEGVVFNPLHSIEDAFTVVEVMREKHEFRIETLMDGWKCYIYAPSKYRGSSGQLDKRIVGYESNKNLCESIVAAAVKALEETGD